MPTSTLIDNLKAIKKHYNLTDKQFGSAIGGVGRSTIETWMNGRNAPQTIHLVAIKGAFGISIDDLCRREITFKDKR